MKRKLRIKEEYVDAYVNHPLTFKDVHMRFVPKDEYQYFFDKAPHLFEEIIKLKKEEVKEEIQEDNIEPAE